MATTATIAPGIFPQGTTVSARKRSNWPAAQQDNPTGTPGAADATAVTAADGTTSFTGLTADTRYFAHATVDGTERYVQFRTDAGSSPGATDVEVVGPVDTELAAAAALGDTGSDAQVIPNVGAALLARDSTSALLKRLRTAKSFNSDASELLPAGMVVRDSASGNHAVVGTGTYGDGLTGTLLMGTAAYVFDGANWQKRRAARIFTSLADTALTAGTGATLWAPTTGKKFRVIGGQLSMSVAGQIILGDNVVGTVILRSPKLAAAGVWNFDLRDMGILSALANNVLKVDVSANANVGGYVFGTEE